MFVFCLQYNYLFYDYGQYYEYKNNITTTVKKKSHQVILLEKGLP